MLNGNETTHTHTAATGTKKYEVAAAINDAALSYGQFMERSQYVF